MKTLVSGAQMGILVARRPRRQLNWREINKLHEVASHLFQVVGDNLITTALAILKSRNII